MRREEGSCPAGNYQLYGWVLGVIFLVWFGFYQKQITKPVFLNQNRTETGSNRPVSI
jgi:hypothetical protein